MFVCRSAFDDRCAFRGHYSGKFDVLSVKSFGRTLFKNFIYDRNRRNGKQCAHDTEAAAADNDRDKRPDRRQSCRVTYDLRRDYVAVDLLNKQYEHREQNCGLKSSVGRNEYQERGRNTSDKRTDYRDNICQTNYYADEDSIVKTEYRQPYEGYDADDCGVKKSSRNKAAESFRANIGGAAYLVRRLLF